MRSAGGRVKIDVALGVAETFLDVLRPLPEAGRVAFAGSLRGMQETIGTSTSSSLAPTRRP